MEIINIDIGRYLYKTRHTYFNQKLLYQQHQSMKSCNPQKTVDLKTSCDNKNGMYCQEKIIERNQLAFQLELTVDLFQTVYGNIGQVQL